MAANIRGLLRVNLGLVGNTIIKNNFLNVGVRFLYTEKSLGLNGYENARLNFRNQFLNVESAFRSKMQNVCQDEKSMIFTEDLKSMLHLVQKKDEDINLVIQMMEKFNNQNQELRFGTFVFGPVVMRTFYFLDVPEIALSAFKNPKLENFFDQYASYQILLCLLYKHNMYPDMRSLYDIIKTKYVDGNMHPKNSLILVMAACYKENTPETLQYALDLWKELNARGYKFLRRAITFLAILAIKQESPQIAIEIMVALKETRYIDTRCLKVLAYAKLSRFIDIVQIFRTSLEYDKPHTLKECYFNDVIEYLEGKMREENVDPNDELFKLINQLRAYDYIVSTQTLEQHLCSPIETNKIPGQRRDFLPLQGSLQRNRFNTNNQRHGMRDLL